MVKDSMDEETFESRSERVDRLSSTADVHGDAWSRTLDDVASLAAEREADGWEAVEIPAGDAGPATADGDVTDRHGVVFVVPGDRVEPFREAFEAGEFPRYDVYRRVVDGRLFLVVELLDPGTETAVLLAGNFWRHRAGALVKEARETGTMYTHLRTLDRTHVGTFEHDGVEKFFPDPDGVIEDWEAMGGAF